MVERNRLVCQASQAGLDRAMQGRGRARYVARGLIERVAKRKKPLPLALVTIGERLFSSPLLRPEAPLQARLYATVHIEAASFSERCLPDERAGGVFLTRGCRSPISFGTG